MEMCTIRSWVRIRVQVTIYRSLYEKTDPGAKMIVGLYATLTKIAYKCRYSHEAERAN